MYYLTKKYKSILKLCMPLILIHICIKKKKLFLKLYVPVSGYRYLQKFLFIIKLTQ